MSRIDARTPPWSGASRSDRVRRRRPTAWAAGLALACLATVCGAPAAAAPPQAPGVQLVEAWPDASFQEPIFVVHAGDGSDHLYVGEQSGRVLRIQKYRGAGPVPKPSPYLDVSRLCYAKSQGGLLSMAFHPQFRTTRRCYVSYLAENANPRNELAFSLKIVEYTDAGGRADPASARVVFEVAKKTAQHQGGCIAFGPDGMLYIGVGDGAEGKDDPQANAQNPRSLLGKILRIDPRPSQGRSWSVPQTEPPQPWPSSPSQVEPSIWAYGFRNPWRFSWDSRGRMWVTEPGTSGPESREWITLVQRGGNHGWPFYEGTRSLKPAPAGQTFVPRSFEWLRGEAGGTAGVGGYFYRGDRVKSLRGKYIFADYMLGEVYSLDLVDQADGRVVGRNWQKVGDCPDVASLGEDEQGELYFCSNGDLATILTLAPSGS